jgi:segregation and condensation protein A
MIASPAFAVNLADYAGPLDLLLYLVRREELDVSTLSLSKITRQYIDFLEILEAFDIDATADFLEPVGVLLEMKARQVIPAPIQDLNIESEAIQEPAENLVQRLIQYKRYRDVATILDEQSRQWQLRYARQADDRPILKAQSKERPIAKIEIWDLVSAFGRILRERQPEPPSQVVYDDTPIHEYMRAIHQQVKDRPRIELQALFRAGQHKSTLVGMFLATLELTRHYGVVADQDGCDGPMWLTKGSQFTEEFHWTEIQDSTLDEATTRNLPVRPR